MKKLSIVLAVSVLWSSALAADVVDQINDVQSGGNGWSYFNPYYEGSQSFKQTANSISGASVYLGDSWGDGNITLDVYSSEPYSSGGSSPVAGASGTAFGTHGGWVDVFWSPVTITAGQTYWLALRGDSGSAVTTFTTGGAYANGSMFWYGSDFSSSGYDFVFKTWAPSGGGGGTEVPASSTTTLILTAALIAVSGMVLLGRSAAR